MMCARIRAVFPRCECNLGRCRFGARLRPSPVAGAPCATGIAEGRQAESQTY